MVLWMVFRHDAVTEIVSMKRDMIGTPLSVKKAVCVQRVRRRPDYF